MKFEYNNLYNVDSYEAIKEIPDKSIDLIYTDIPYFIEPGGYGTSSVSTRIRRLRNVDLKDITSGIDYKILDEFVRIQPHIYIYIYGVANYKY